MVNALLVAYLVVPVLLGLAAAWFVLTRPADRIQLASASLFSCTLLYGGVALDIATRHQEMFLSVLLGGYAIVLYVTLGALAIYFKRWAWRVATGAFVVHLLLGVAFASAAAERGNTGYAILGVYFAVGVVGLWASLHRGTRNAIESAATAEV
jgi:hypothetical protein